MEGSRKKNEETPKEINRKDEINSIEYLLGKVKKSLEEFDKVHKLLLEKINTLLQKED
jgi:hypothetical protein